MSSCKMDHHERKTIPHKTQKLLEVTPVSSSPFPKLKKLVPAHEAGSLHLDSPSKDTGHDTLVDADAAQD